MRRFQLSKDMRDQEEVMLITKVRSGGISVFRITVLMSVGKNINVLNYNPMNSHPVQRWLWGFGAES